MSRVRDRVVDNDKDALENVQRRATKQINGMKDIPIPS